MTEETLTSRRVGIARMLAFSAVGIIAFFLPVTIGGKSTIPIDHLVTGLRAGLGVELSRWLGLAIMLAGAVIPLRTRAWKRTRQAAIFAWINLIGLILGVLIVLGMGPAWLLNPALGPYLLDKVVVPVGLIVPIGAIFLALLTNYGLMEMIGVLMQRVMRPIFRVPGKASLDAVASFVGSYSLGLLITGRMYREGNYTAREATIIATGFSTVSTTFMVIVAQTLGLTERWNLYFWSTLAVTFTVTAITARLWPIVSVPDESAPGVTHRPESFGSGNLLRRSWQDGVSAAQQSGNLWTNLVSTFRTGLQMACTILPAVLTFGVIGLVIATYTPVFTWIGWLFRPILMVFGIADVDIMATGAAASFADMFVPALLAADANPTAQFLVGILCVSEIIFLSGVVPCIYATGIPISFGRLVAIWFVRVVLTLLIATPLALLVT